MPTTTQWSMPELLNSGTDGRPLAKGQLCFQSALRPTSMDSPVRPPTVAMVGVLTTRPGRPWIQAASSAALPPTPGSGAAAQVASCEAAFGSRNRCIPIRSLSSGRRVR